VFVIPNRVSGEEPVFSHHQQKSRFLARSLSPRVARLRAARNDNDWNLKLILKIESDYASAPLACSTSVLNAGASFTARSARILRSSSTPAFFNPWINWL
jgi:hypothetical protein